MKVYITVNDCLDFNILFLYFYSLNLSSLFEVTVIFGVYVVSFEIF